MYSPFLGVSAVAFALCLHAFVSMIHIHTHIHTYIHTCLHTYIPTYIHIYIHTYIYTYIYTRGAQTFPLPDNILAEKSGKITYILTHHFIWRRSRRKIPIQSAGAKTALSGSRVRLVMALRLKTYTLKTVGSIHMIRLTWEKSPPVRSPVLVYRWSKERPPN